jgi:hypothetical protein
LERGLDDSLIVGLMIIGSLEAIYVMVAVESALDRRRLHLLNHPWFAAGSDGMRAREEMRARSEGRAV